MVRRSRRNTFGRGVVLRTQSSIKRANKRNLLRRRTKEAYRLQKLLLHNGRPVNLDLALIYSSKEELSYKTISNAVRRILETVAEHL